MRGAHIERSRLERLDVPYLTLVSEAARKYVRAEHVPIGLRFKLHRIYHFVATSMH